MTSISSYQSLELGALLQSLFFVSLERLRPLQIVCNFEVSFASGLSGWTSINCNGLHKSLSAKSLSWQFHTKMSQIRSCLLRVGAPIQNTKQNHSYYSFSLRPWLCRSMPYSKMLTGSLSSALQPFQSADWNHSELLHSSWAGDIGGLSSWVLGSWSVDLPRWLWNRTWLPLLFD